MQGPRNRRKTRHKSSVIRGKSQKPPNIPHGRGPRGSGAPGCHVARGPGPSGPPGLRAAEREFSQRCRLFVGNLPSDTGEADFLALFRRYGDAAEAFVSKGKGFGFIRLRTRMLAEMAKAELDGTIVRSRELRVRFATHSGALRVRNLSPQVTNELLEEAFSVFGQLERAIVIVDDRGRSTGRGIVEFASKQSAKKALDRCRESNYLLTSSLRPVLVEPLEHLDEDGILDKHLQKHPQYSKERECAPRFAQPGTFEYEYAMRWKALEQMERQQKETVELNVREAAERLELDVEGAHVEHQAMLMRQDLMRREEELRRFEEMRNSEAQKRKMMEMRYEEERKRREEELLKKQKEQEERFRAKFAEHGVRDRDTGRETRGERDMGRERHGERETRGERDTGRERHGERDTGRETRGERHGERDTGRERHGMGVNPGFGPRADSTEFEAKRARF
ncbi:unnamed protein product [Lampetra planeri]